MIDTIEVQTEMRTFVSRWSGKTYEGFYRDGKQVGCRCGWKQAMEKYNNFSPCKHMIDYEQRKRDEERTRYLYYELSLGI